MFSFPIPFHSLRVNVPTGRYWAPKGPVCNLVTIKTNSILSEVVPLIHHLRFFHLPIPSSTIERKLYVTPDKEPRPREIYDPFPRVSRYRVGQLWRTVFFFKICNFSRVWLSLFLFLRIVKSFMAIYRGYVSSVDIFQWKIKITKLYAFYIGQSMLAHFVSVLILYDGVVRRRNDQDRFSSQQWVTSKS